MLPLLTPRVPVLRSGRILLGIVAAAAHELALGQANIAVRPQAPTGRHETTAADKAPIELLLQQGRHWQSQGNGELAEQAWRKVLTAEPHRAEALYGLAWVKLESGNTAAAQPFIDELRTLPSAAAFMARLAQDRQLTGKGPQLRTARALAQAGKADEAVAAYQGVLGKAPPSGPVALEYYQAIGNTMDGWEEARQGLERLSVEAPSDNRLALALAQHLTYSDGTRRDGIKRLAALTARPDVARDADTSWKKAISWLTLVPSSGPYFRDYLLRHPEDTKIRATLADMERATADGAFQQIEPDPAITQSQLGFQALKAARVGAAESAFEASLRLRANLPASVGGLGLVRLQQKRFAEAVGLLDRARQIGKADQARQWDGALRSARYWVAVESAASARKAGDLDGAARLLAEAVALDPREPAADLMLGELHASRQEYGAAIADYRRVLAARPGDAGGLAGLAAALENNGQLDEARTLLDGLTPAQQVALGNLGPLRARMLTATARTQLDRGDTELAQRTYMQAVQANPQDPWNRLALARLLQQSGRPDDATLVMRPLPGDAGAVDLASPAYLHARALFDYDRSDWAATRQGLERIAPAERTAPMLGLLQTASVQQELQAASHSAAAGALAEAAQARGRAAATAGDRGELLLVVAVADAASGDAAAVPQAQALFARATAADPTLLPGLQLQYAAALYAGGHDEAAGPLLARLGALTLDPTQRRGMEGLRKASAMRQTEQLRAQGDFAAAEAMLRPVRSQYPDDQDVLAAQARILGGSARHAEALALYRRALVARPGDAGLLMGAAREAMALRYDTAAQALLEDAIAAAGDDPRILMEAARYYRARGRTERAEQLLAQAMAADTRRAADSVRIRAPRVPPAGPLQKMSQNGALLRNGFVRTAWHADVAQVAQADPPPQDNPPEQPRPSTVPAALTAQERTMLQDDLNLLRGERSPLISSGLVVRSRRGEAGLSRLVDTEAPVEMRWVRGDANLMVKVTPTVLGSGTPDLLTAGSRFGSGSGPPGIATPTLSPGNQHDRGVGLSAGYEQYGLQADIGTTPIGFQRVNVVGGAKVTRNIDSQWSWSGEVSRRAVTDSILAFAGVRDARTGTQFGGVTATGGRVQLGWDQQTWGLYGFGSLHALRGANVANNSRVEVGAGLYRHLWRNDDGQLTTGVNVSTSSYDRNLRYFTEGQGGYFSPQRYSSISIPLDWSQRNGNLSWRVRGAVGAQRFREDASPLFPTNAVAQAASSNAVYAGQSRRGLAYSTSVALEYRATPRASIGALAALDNSRDYRQLMAGVYVKLSFEPWAGPMAMPIVPLRSPYAAP